MEPNSVMKIFCFHVYANHFVLKELLKACLKLWKYGALSNAIIMKDINLYDPVYLQLQNYKMVHMQRFFIGGSFCSFSVKQKNFIQWDDMTMISNKSN